MFYGLSLILVTVAHENLWDKRVRWYVAGFSKINTLFFDGLRRSKS